MKNVSAAKEHLLSLFKKNKEITVRKYNFDEFTKQYEEGLENALQEKFGDQSIKQARHCLMNVWYEAAQAHTKKWTQLELGVGALGMGSGHMLFLKAGCLSEHMAGLGLMAMCGFLIKTNLSRKEDHSLSSPAKLCHPSPDDPGSPAIYRKAEDVLRKTCGSIGIKAPVPAPIP